jgi:hypothetical protein
MDLQLFATEAARLLVGAFATFCAILLWSRTRDMAWTFVIIGAILSYAGIVYANLIAFGIMESELLVYGGVPVVRIILDDLPVLFMGIGFLLARRRRR